VLTDIANGKLAQVTWIVPAFNNSDHPGAPAQGPDWVASIVNAIGASKFWNSTTIFIAWDDWGGFYDHVPPPQTDDMGLGFRVPVIVVGPYARRGYISHVTHESSGFLRYMEEVFGLPSLGTRDSNADDFHDCFDYDAAAHALRAGEDESLRRVLPEAETVRPARTTTTTEIALCLVRASGLSASRRGDLLFLLPCLALGATTLLCHLLPSSPRVPPDRMQLFNWFAMVFLCLWAIALPKPTPEATSLFRRILLGLASYGFLGICVTAVRTLAAANRDAFHFAKSAYILPVAWLAVVLYWIAILRPHTDPHTDQTDTPPTVAGVARPRRLIFYPPPNILRKNRPTTCTRSFDGFAFAGAAAETTGTALAGALGCSPPGALYTSVSLTCAWTTPGGACGTSAPGASPSLTAAGNGCAAFAFAAAGASFSPAPGTTPGASSASATDIPLSGHPHGDVSWSTTSCTLPCSNNTCCPGSRSYSASPNGSETASVGATTPRFSTHVSPLRAIRIRRSSRPPPRTANRRSGVITASLAVAIIWISIAPRSSENSSGADSSAARLSVTCSTLVWQTFTVPPLPSAISAVWSFAVTLTDPASTALPPTTSVAPVTSASLVDTYPISCCARTGPAAAHTSAHASPTPKHVEAAGKNLLRNTMRPAYIFRKFAIICLPCVVSTLSG
jgi:hypothetical protein